MPVLASEIVIEDDSSAEVMETRGQLEERL